jgi:hypothetical protein
VRSSPKNRIDTGRRRRERHGSVGAVSRSSGFDTIRSLSSRHQCYFGDRIASNRSDARWYVRRGEITAAPP